MLAAIVAFLRQASGSPGSSKLEYRLCTANLPGKDGSEGWLPVLCISAPISSGVSQRLQQSKPWQTGKIIGEFLVKEDKNGKSKRFMGDQLPGECLHSLLQAQDT